MGAKVKKGDMNKKKGKEKKRERSRDESITFPTSFLLSFVSSLYSAIDDLGTNLCGKTNHAIRTLFRNSIKLL